MNTCQHLTNTAKLFPGKTALVFEGRSWTYGELELKSRTVTSQLAAAGIGVGDRVALMLPNTPSFVVWYYGALRLGAIAVSVSTRLTSDEVTFLLQDCSAKAFVFAESESVNLADATQDLVKLQVAASDLADEIEDDTTLPSDCWDGNPQDPALILYTSGTTGFAKGATLSHGNVRSNVCAFNHLCNMQPADRILLSVPLFHCFGQNALLNSAFNVGATLILQRRFELHETKELILKNKVTQLYGVPLMFQLLLAHCEPKELSTISYSFSAAATLPIQVSQAWQQKFGMPIHEGYGLTETSPFASYNHRIQFRSGSIGTPIDSVEMKIVDTESGEECRPGDLGEIIIRGPNVMLGYWNRQEDTEKAIRDGWFHSGDIGRVNEDGFFFIVDRVKDMISVGALKVFPAEVERVLLDHPSISQVAVVGLADEIFGEQVVAFVVLESTTESVAAELEAIRDYAKLKLANYKIPRQFTHIEELPRNPSGKILKTKLREMGVSKVTIENTEPSSDIGDSGLVTAMTRPPVLRAKLAETYENFRQQVAVEYLQGLVREITEIEHELDPDTRFLDAGMDSMMIVEMSTQIQVELGDQEISPTLIFDHPRIENLATFLVERLSPEKATTQTHDISEAVTPREDDQVNVENMSEAEALQALLKELEE